MGLLGGLLGGLPAGVRRLLAAGGLALVVLGVSAGAGAANPLAKMGGAWSGAGEFRLQDGRSERIRCSALYAPRSGASLGLALRCASAGNRIELRASLVSRGTRVSGSWEERSYNASGTVSGIAAGNSLRLADQRRRPQRLHGGDDQRPVAVDLGAHRRVGAARREHQPAPQLDGAQARNGLRSPLVADAAHGAVAADEHEVVAERQQLGLDAADQGVVVAVGESRCGRWSR